MSTDKKSMPSLAEVYVSTKYSNVFNNETALHIYILLDKLIMILLNTKSAQHTSRWFYLPQNETSNKLSPTYSWLSHVFQSIHGHCYLMRYGFVLRFPNFILPRFCTRVSTHFAKQIKYLNCSLISHPIDKVNSHFKWLWYVFAVLLVIYVGTENDC